MEESEHGVIFFALGATFKPEDIPEHQMEAFLEAFGRLPQRVLVRMQLPREILPSNVLARNFFPQASILRHGVLVL